MASKSKKEVSSTISKIKQILISQPRPEGTKSPYFDLEKKYKVQLKFHPFVLVDGISVREFRKQKVDILSYSAIIFTSRFAIDHFFRICDEMKIKVNPEMKYFCLSEAVALYLHKFILFRKRKVFYAEDGTIKGLISTIGKYKTDEKFIVPSSDINKKDIIDYLSEHGSEFIEATLYKTICNNIKDVLAEKNDFIIFFSPAGVKSLFENDPSYEQQDTIIGAFGPTTCKAIEDCGLTLHIKAPAPNAPSMVAALEQYLQYLRKKRS
jgi:uroporphyrinogen-III synthase